MPDGPALATATDCIHCPASACVALSSCAGQGPALTDARGADVAPRHGATGAGPVWIPAFSVTGQPPTPPPSALL